MDFPNRWISTRNFVDVDKKPVLSFWLKTVEET